MTLLACALAWLLAATAAALGVPPIVALPAALATGAILPARGTGTRLLHVAAACAVCLVAIVRLAQPASPTATGLGREIGTPVRLLAVVDEDGDAYPSSTVVTASTMAVARSGEWTSLGGRVQVTTAPSADLRAGDEVTLAGRLERAGGDHASGDYADYLARRGVVASLYFPTVVLISRGPAGGIGSTWAEARTRLQRSLAALVGPREGAFASALLFGDAHALPRDLRHDLTLTGTSHLVAITSFNLVLLYGTLLSLLGPFVGRRRAVLVAAAAALAYGSGAGQSATVMRGELLVALLALGVLSGRPHSRPALLLLAAAAITALQPALIGDAGFQLTFLAAGGIALLAPVIGRGFDGIRDRTVPERRLPRLVPAVVDAGAVSVAVTLATLPVTVTTFHAINPFAPLVNALLNPLIPFVTAYSLLVAVTGVVMPVGGQVLAAPLWMATTAILSAIRLFAGLPGASISLSLPVWPFVGAWYGVLLGLGYLAPRAGRWLSRYPPPGPAAHRGRQGRRLLPGYLVAGLALTALVIPSVSAARGAIGSNSPASVTWLHLSGAAALVVRGSNGLRLLVLDDGDRAGVGIAQLLESNGIPHVDALIALRSVDAAQTGSAPVIRAHLGARAIFYPAPAGSSAREPGGSAAGVFEVAGKATVALGGNDSLTLLTDGGEAIVLMQIAGHRVAVGAVGAVSRLLRRWQEPEGVEVFAAQTAATERTLGELHALHPAIVVLRGSGASDPNAAAAAGASGATVIDPARVDGLQLRAAGNRLRLSYRERSQQTR